MVTRHMLPQATQKEDITIEKIELTPSHPTVTPDKSSTYRGLTAAFEAKGVGESYEAVSLPPITFRLYI